MDGISVVIIKDFIREGKTYQKISDILKEQFPNEGGFSRMRDFAPTTAYCHFFQCNNYKLKFLYHEV